MLPHTPNRLFFALKKLGLVLFISLCCCSISLVAQDDSTKTGEPVTENPATPPVENPSADTPPSNIGTVEPQPATPTPTPVTPRPTPRPTTNSNTERERPTTPTPTVSNPVPAPVKVDTVPEIKLDNDNPFELVDYGKPRIDEKTADEPEDDQPTKRDTSINYNNPFELVKNGNIAMLEMVEGPVTDKKSKKKNKKKKKKKRKKKNEKPLFDQKQLDFNAIIKFSALLVITIFLTYLTTTFRTDLLKIYRAFNNNNMMVQLYREKPSLLQMPYIPLYILFAFTGGAFFYLVLDYFKITIFDNSAYTILACIGSLGVFYLFKHILLKTLGVVFPIKKEVNQYHFIVGIFNQIIGLALIPLITVIAFAPQNIKLFAIYGALGIIAIIWIHRLIRSVLVAQNFLAFHKFHLFVYLCTVEIAPLFIILKLAMN